MKLVRKSLCRNEWVGIQGTTKSMVIHEEAFTGTIGLLEIKRVDKPFIINNIKKNICIADVGYHWLQLAPKNANWWLTVVYNENGDLLESYFDITKQNDFSDELHPTFIDMFLDVVIDEDKIPTILDEDELKEALNLKLITNTEYEMALSLAKNIVNCYNRNKAKYYEWIDRFYHMLSF